MIAEEIKKSFPGIFVYSIIIGSGDAASDIKTSFLDNLDRQIDEVCQKLKSVKELITGFDAVGFSQGGQFLRAYVERCNDPPVKRLITVGAQHQGIMNLPGCNGKFCRSWWQRWIKSNVYSKVAQQHSVQAQYFKVEDVYLFDI